MSTTTLERHTQNELRLLHIAAMLALFCVGVYAATFGPALPFIADDLGVSLDSAGLLLSALFAGSISASAAIALWLHGRDARSLTITGLLCAIVGTLLIGMAQNWPTALAGAVILGIGDGLVVAALHILMTLTSRDVPSAINQLNLYFAVGAVAGPIWAGAVLATSGDRSIVYGGVASLLFVTLMLTVAATAPTHEPIASDEDEGFRLPGTSTAWIMGGLLFLYVGAEFGLGAWVSSYARETADAGVFEAALLTAGYWFALMCGRLISALYFSRGHESSLLLAAAIAGAGLAAVVLAITSGNIVLSAAAAFVTGLCLGPVWPATLAIASHGSRPNATATTVTMGNAGGLLIPWLQGKVLVGAGPTQGIIVTSVLCAVMFGIVMAFRSRERAVAENVARRA